MRITDYIGEATEYDKKQALEIKHPKSWLKSVSAFANGIGGALIFGVDDAESLVGLADVKETSEKISELVKTRMDPIPVVNMKVHKENGLDFIILSVPPGDETPYYYVGEGSHTAFVRIGNQSVTADALALKRLVLRGSKTTYDSTLSPYKRSDYSFTKLRNVYKKKTGKIFNDSDYVSFGLADENGELTIAGALFADDSPIYQSRLFCTRWHGLDKASGIIDALDDKEYSGSLLHLLDSGEDFIKTNTKKRWKKRDEDRINMPDYPPRAVTECLVNALIHRDYTEPGSEVHIDIFDDRMEVYSPGGMFDGSVIQDLDLLYVPSKRRNPIIADLFNRMDLMERRGSGFRRIKEAYENAANFRDIVCSSYYSTHSTFIATLYNLNYGVPVETTNTEPKQAIGPEKQAIEGKKQSIHAEKQAFEQALSGIDVTAKTKNNIRALYYSFGTEKAFGRSDISEVIGITSSPAGSLINKMLDCGMLEPVSGLGKGRYRFSL